MLVPDPLSILVGLLFSNDFLLVVAAIALSFPQHAVEMVDRNMRSVLPHGI